MTTKTKTKQSRGQAARVENAVDLNIAFHRAYKLFVRKYHADPDWNKANAQLVIQNGSVVCEIREE